MASNFSVVLMDGSPIPVDSSLCSSVSQLRLLVAEALLVEAAQVQLLANQRELCSEEALLELEGIDVINVVLRAPEVAIYVADGGNHRVLKWMPGETSGAVVAGSGIAGDGLEQLSLPKGIFVDHEGALIIADSANHRIMKWRRGQSSGQIVSCQSAEADAIGPPRGPRGVFVDKADAIYVAEFLGHRVTCCTPDGTQGRVVADSNLADSVPEQWTRHPANIFVTVDGAVYVAEFGNDRVTKWLPGATRGDVVAGGRGKGRGTDQLDAPWGLAVDADGALYVSETNNHRVTRWKPGSDRGEVVAGGRGSGAGLSQLAGPTGICMDSDGKLYIAENHNHRITCWIPGAAEGEVVAGGNGSGSQENQLNHPTDVFVS